MVLLSVLTNCEYHEAEKRAGHLGGFSLNQDELRPLQKELKHAENILCSFFNP